MYFLLPVWGTRAVLEMPPQIPMRWLGLGYAEVFSPHPAYTFLAPIAGGGALFVHGTVLGHETNPQLTFLQLPPAELSTLPRQCRDALRKLERPPLHVVLQRLNVKVPHEPALPARKRDPAPRASRRRRTCLRY